MKARTLNQPEHYSGITVLSGVAQRAIAGAAQYTLLTIQQNNGHYPARDWESYFLYHIYKAGYFNISAPSFTKHPLQKHQLLNAVELDNFTNTLSQLSIIDTAIFAVIISFIAELAAIDKA